MKIKAFSILEAVVGMVITAVIIGLVFLVFSILSDRLIDFKHVNQLTSDMNRLSYALNKDIFESSQLQLDEEENMVFISDLKEDRVYKVNENFLLRYEGNFTDTFHVHVKKIIVDTLADSKNCKTFQRITISMGVDKPSDTLLFFKRLDPSRLLENLDY